MRADTFKCAINVAERLDKTQAQLHTMIQQLNYSTGTEPDPMGASRGSGSPPPRPLTRPQHG